MYKFKKGDKGKTRSGDSYEVVIDDLNNAMFPLVVRLKYESVGEEDMTMCTCFGRVHMHRECDADLLPPTKTVWYSLFKSGPGCRYFDTEAEAHLTGAAAIRDKYICTRSVEIPSD